MEEQSSWKGHTFTLMIFGGIVVLCSIFFVLGMLVGRTQSQKVGTAEASAAKAPVKEVAREERPEMTFYGSADRNDKNDNKSAPALYPAPLVPVPAPAAPPVVVKREEPARVEPPPPQPPAATGISYQVSALAKRPDAEKLVNELKKKGFTKAFMLTPLPSDAKPVYRVQVGPIADPTEAESTRLKLVAAGYSPIKK